MLLYETKGAEIKIISDKNQIYHELAMAEDVYRDSGLREKLLACCEKLAPQFPSQQIEASNHGAIVWPGVLISSGTNYGSSRLDLIYNSVISNGRNQLNLYGIYSEEKNGVRSGRRLQPRGVAPAIAWSLEYSLTSQPEDLNQMPLRLLRQLSRQTNPAYETFLKSVSAAL